MHDEEEKMRLLKSLHKQALFVYREWLKKNCECEEKENCSCPDFQEWIDARCEENKQ